MLSIGRSLVASRGETRFGVAGQSHVKWLPALLELAKPVGGLRAMRGIPLPPRLCIVGQGFVRDFAEGAIGVRHIPGGQSVVGGSIQAIELNKDSATKTE